MRTGMDISRENGIREVYQIHVEGVLDERWAEWFSGLTVLHRGQRETVFTATVPDQAALRGILNRLWDLNLPVISVSRLRTHVVP